MAKSTRNYDIGKGKPPVKNRWKKGQSGNPSGRRKDAKSFNTILREQLDQHIEIEEGGRTRRITLYEAMVRNFLNKAVRGDPKAISYIVGNEQKIFPKPVEPVRQFGPEVSQKDASEIYMRMIKGITS